MKKALITQRQSLDSYGCQIDVMEASYVKYFEQIGVFTIPVSNFYNDCSFVFDVVEPDFIILTGGGSLPVEYYSEDYGYELQCERDKTEFCLIEESIRREIPIIAICRGMQIINGYFGGKISKLDKLKTPRKNNVCHPVKNLKTSEIFYVNNFHNDGIFLNNLSNIAVPLAIDTDNNVVEAYEIPGKRILALQWHPERKFEEEYMEEYTRNIIKNFLNKNSI